VAINWYLKKATLICKPIIRGETMNITTDIKPVSYLKSKSADLLKQINETHRPVIITQNGEPKAVLQDRKHA